VYSLRCRFEAGPFDAEAPSSSSARSPGGATSPEGSTHRAPRRRAGPPRSRPMPPCGVPSVPTAVHPGCVRRHDPDAIDRTGPPPLNAGARGRGTLRRGARHHRLDAAAVRDRLSPRDGGRARVDGHGPRPAAPRPRARPTPGRRSPPGGPPHDPAARAGDPILRAERVPGDGSPGRVLRHGDAPVCTHARSARAEGHAQETPAAVTVPTGKRKQREEIVQENVAVP